MAYDNLSDFLNDLKDDGELRRVTAEVDSSLEVAAMVHRLSRQPGGGPAVLFEKVRGSGFPLVANVLGHPRRICRAFGNRSFEEIGERIAALLHPEADAPEGWMQRLKRVPQAGAPVLIPPSVIKTGSAQQVVKVGRDIDLDELPALQCWPEERRRSLTAGQIFLRHPESGARVLERFPLSLQNRNSLSAHWHAHHRAQEIFLAHRARGTQMPVVVAFGGDPVLGYLAAAGIPVPHDPLEFAGFLRGKSIELVKCRQIELEAPAHAEVILEGYIDPTQNWEPSSTIANETGFYTLETTVPTVHVTAMTHRANPVLTAIVPDRPPSEDSAIRDAAERLALPWIRRFLPEVIDVHSPRSGAGKMCFVSIRKQFPQQAKKVMHGLWGLQQTMFAKFLVVVDETVDVRDEQAVWFCVSSHADPLRDVLASEGVAAPYDHAAPAGRAAGRLGIDATPKLPEETGGTTWPGPLELSPSVRARLDQRWHELKLGSPVSERPTQ